MGSRTGKGRRIVYIFRHYSVFILCLYSVPNEIEILPAGRTVRRYNHSLLAVYGNYPLYKIRARDLILSFHRRTLERKSNRVFAPECSVHRVLSCTSTVAWGKQTFQRNNNPFP